MINLIKDKTITLVMHKATNYALLFFIFSCLIFYVYFANAAVRTLTVLEKSKAEIQSLNVKVSEMETQRLVVDNSVSNALATHLGFVEVKNQTFIINKSKKTAFSFKID